MKTIILALMMTIVTLAVAESSNDLHMAPAPKFEDMPELPVSTTKGVAAPAVNNYNRSDVVNYWKNVYMSSEEVDANWSGNVESCIPGSVEPNYMEATMRRLNFYRAMAGVPSDVALDPALSAKNQSSALIIIANGKLSHFPTADWKCYTPEGAEASSRSLIALGGAGAEAVDLYMKDDGDFNGNVGHRRWILFPAQKAMGTGSTTAESGRYRGSNSIWAIGQFGPRPATSRPEVAWPAAGFFPYQVVPARWSFTYPKADFSNATVSMDVEGIGSPSIELEPIENGYADNTLVWKPSFWLAASETKPEADRNVRVRVQNVVVDGKAMNFEYTVTIIDPDKAAPAPKKSDAVDVLLSVASAHNLDVNGDGIVDAADVVRAN